MTDWPEVLEYLKDYSHVIASAFHGSVAYVNGDFVLIDAPNSMAFELLRKSAQRDKMRIAIKEITGRTYKLGPYRREYQEDVYKRQHSYPLHVIYIHLRRLAEKNTNIIVAERLKRLDSIVNKLKREPNMSLWTMQDLGGCRFIVPTLEEVYDYANKYKKSRIRHKYIQTYDYIRCV